MEDRHYFSDPRPIEKGCDIPTWQVDVFRQGVQEPVFTLLIDKTTLPPRTRKKKVVWKLPDSTDEVPNFGSDERKRLLELFKKQKKTRKKQLKRTSSIAIQNQNEDTETSAAVALESEAVSPLDLDHLPPHPASVNPAPSGMPLHNNEMTPLRTNGHLNEQASSDEAPTTPPPGFANLALAPVQQVDNERKQQSTTPNGRYFAVPALSTNVPVDLAKLVVDVYYPCIALNHSQELVRYYSADAQKSLSVGGAHAVCSARDTTSGEGGGNCSSPLLLQLQSLQGSEFLVRGVVAQPGIQDSVVLLITGSVQNAATLQVLPFCHSLTMIQVKQHQSPRSFQIQNDAMALLTD